MFNHLFFRVSYLIVKRFCRIRDKVRNQLIMDQIPIKFLESAVQNISFGFPEISNSATEKIFSVLILVYLVNRLFTCLGRIIERESMLEFYISFVEGIIYVITFCYLTNSTWYFLPWVYILWFLGTIWCYIVYLIYNI